MRWVLPRPLPPEYFFRAAVDLDFSSFFDLSLHALFAVEVTRPVMSASWTGVLVFISASISPAMARVVSFFRDAAINLLACFSVSAFSTSLSSLVKRAGTINASCARVALIASCIPVLIGFCFSKISQVVGVGAAAVAEAAAAANAAPAANAARAIASVVAGAGVPGVATAVAGALLLLLLLLLLLAVSSASSSSSLSSLLLPGGMGVSSVVVVAFAVGVVGAVRGTAKIGGSGCIGGGAPSAGRSPIVLPVVWSARYFRVIVTLPASLIMYFL